MSDGGCGARLIASLREARDTPAKLALLNQSFRLLQALQLSHDSVEVPPTQPAPQHQSFTSARTSATVDDGDGPFINLIQATPRDSFSQPSLDGESSFHEYGGAGSAYEDGHVFDAVVMAEFLSEAHDVAAFVFFCFNQRYAHSVLSSSTSYVMRDAGGGLGTSLSPVEAVKDVVVSGVHKVGSRPITPEISSAFELEARQRHKANVMLDALIQWFARCLCDGGVRSHACTHRLLVQRFDETVLAALAFTINNRLLSFKNCRSPKLI